MLHKFNLLFLFFFALFVGSQGCANFTRYYSLESWDWQSFIKFGARIPMDITIRKGWDGYTPQIWLTIFAPTEDEASQYGFHIVETEDELKNNSALFLLRQPIGIAEEEEEPDTDSAGSALPNTLFRSLSLLPALFGTFVSSSSPSFLSANSIDKKQCTLRGEMVFTLSPVQYQEIVEAFANDYLEFQVDNYSFDENATIPTIEDCRDVAVAEQFTLTCEELFRQAGLEPSTTDSLLRLTNVMRYYNPTEWPHQKCAIDKLQEVLDNAPYRGEFACKWRQNAPGCDAAIKLEDVAKFYDNGINHHKESVDFLQSKLETDVSMWQKFIKYWRNEEVCVNWEILNTGRCGPDFNNAGCNPNRNPCCSEAGWCGVTDAHCRGKDYRDPYGYLKPKDPVKLTGHACSGSHPLTGRPGVCIDKQKCDDVGGTTQTGLCPNDPNNILCCDGRNFELDFQTSSDLCGAYEGKQVYSIEGNGGRTFQVVKIIPEDLTDPSIYNRAPDEKDNTMTTATACAYDKLRSAAWAEEVWVKITSGFRTVGRQRYFWQCYQCQCCNSGNLAAVPGTSPHGVGVALDLNTNCGRQYGNRPNCGGSRVYQWLYNNAHKYGFKRTVQSEPWHWEYKGPGPVQRAWFS